MKLSQLRSQIDHIDRQLLFLIHKRIEVARKIAHLKKEQGLPIFDSEREEAIKVQIHKAAEERCLEPQIMETIFQMLLDYTKKEMGNCD